MLGAVVLVGRNLETVGKWLSELRAWQFAPFALAWGYGPWVLLIGGVLYGLYASLANRVSHDSRVLSGKLDELIQSVARQQTTIASQTTYLNQLASRMDGVDEVLLKMQRLISDKLGALP